jgi:hypothetical protein
MLSLVTFKMHGKRGIGVLASLHEPLPVPRSRRLRIQRPVNLGLGQLRSGSDRHHGARVVYAKRIPGSVCQLMRVLYCLDTFVCSSRDARLAHIQISIALGLYSTRGRTVTDIAEELGIINRR